MLCVLWDVISRLTCDAELDVYLAVRQLHSARPEALTSVVSRSVGLSVGLSACLSARLPACLPACLPIGRSVGRSVNCTVSDPRSSLPW